MHKNAQAALTNTTITIY